MINNIAVVMGGSIAGLLAARALSSHFEIVLILDNNLLEDRLSSTYENILTIPNVGFIGNVSVVDICVDSVENRVSGVVFEDHNSGQLETLMCGLVVDANGRESFMPHWLTMAGYPQVEQSELATDMHYISCTFEAPEEFQPDWTSLSIYPTSAHQLTGYINKIRGNLYIVTLISNVGEMSQIDDVVFLEYARQLSQPDIYDFLCQSRPVSDFYIDQMPSSRRYHYEKLSSFPDGLAVVGAALDNLHSVWDQSDMLARLESLVLKRVIEKYAEEDSLRDGFGLYFQKQISKVADIPWADIPHTDLWNFNIGANVSPEFVGNWNVRPIREAIRFYA
jgi:2-polyprenyl-6-methoxyphenol hydroxylase-like FAD-dependent oxidoreductase